MSTYQDVVAANGALGAWALTEAAGLLFAPYLGGSNLVGTGVFDYQQAGPFGASFGLRSHIGAKTTLTFVAVVNPPATTEAWLNFAAVPPAANTLLWGTGNGGLNGVQPYLSNIGEIHVQLGGVADVNTHVLWPGVGWHLLQVASAGLGNILTVAVDGIVRFRNTVAVANAPAPNVLVFTGDSAGGAAVLETISFPAFYATELTSAQLYASFLASTNPADALQLTLTGGAGSGASANDLLTEILAAVRRTFPTT